MNRIACENEFRIGIKRVLAEIDMQFASGTANPCASARDEVFHEHDTRVFIFDRLLELLGWNLGAGGNVAQEARIKVGTTKFVDYVGVNADTRAPVLILEAKAWDKPIIAGKGERRDRPKSNLIVEAIEHINAGGGKENSPVIAEWHENLSQLAGYVCMFKEQQGHSVSRAVLSSGQWLLIFKTPVSTFCDFDVNDQQFYLFERDAYVANAHAIFEQMARVMLADTAPIRIRPSQLGNYVSADNFSAAYHGMLIHYESSGSPLLAQRPRILVYPSVIIQRDNGALFNVIDDENPIAMQISRTNGGRETLAPHIEKVKNAAEKLLRSCSDELELPLEPGELADFPGFPGESEMAAGGLALGKAKKLLVQPVRSVANNWLLVTGSQTHFLHELPNVACRFHAWAECNAVHKSIGANAINSPAMENPRSFFVDSQPHHCAHRSVVDRRDTRCYIKAIDARTCCMACVYKGFCWPQTEVAALPCGQ